ncbi:MAG TPA: Gfo/Idh/MocA family oxidoreductase [Bacillales bacterium]
MRNLRIGIVGVGRFGRLHLRVLSQLAGCEVAAVSDINEDLLHEVAREFQIEETFTDPVDMVRDADLDMIDVVSDEQTHGQLVLESLRHGKHVFVEKPLSTTYEEAEKIELAASQYNKQVMVGNINRFSQPYVAIKRAVTANSLGDLGMIRAKRNFSKEWFENFGKRVHPVYESGIHDIDLFLWYTESRCKNVYAVERNLSGYAYPDLFSAVLEFENGVVASLDSAWLVPKGGPRNLTETLELDGTIDADIEVMGEKGTANFQLGHSGYSVWTDQGATNPELTLWPTEHDGIGGAIRAELQHFLLQLEKGEESSVAPLSHSVEALKIADAIVLSAKEKRRIQLVEGDSI